MTPVSQWQYIAQPLLIGTVALGGAYNILPVVFLKVKQRTKDIRIFLMCSLSGLTLVWIFNILWCYFILQIVPQTGPHDDDKTNVTTLRGAERWGEISTVPLSNIINSAYPQFKWIATIIMLFTVISVTVSFIVNGVALKHVLDGLIKGWKAVDESPNMRFWKRWWRKISSIGDRYKKAILYISSFAFILILALANPKGFLSIMERITSFALNFTGGVAICWMLDASRKLIQDVVPLPVIKPLFMLRWVVLTFFSLAILYDIVSWIAHAAGVTYL